MGYGKDEKFWYYGGSLKSLIFSGRFTISGELPKALQFAGLRGGLTKKMGVVLLRGVDTLMHTVKWNQMFYLLGNCHTNVTIN